MGIVLNEPGSGSDLQSFATSWNSDSQTHPLEALFPNRTQPAKRKRPKNSMQKTNSSFISRVIRHEKIEERWNQRTPGSVFAFVNRNRAFEWLDLSSPTTVRNF